MKRMRGGLHSEGGGADAWRSVYLRDLSAAEHAAGRRRVGRGARTVATVRDMIESPQSRQEPSGTARRAEIS